LVLDEEPERCHQVELDHQGQRAELLGGNSGLVQGGQIC
jgi:hypothetical protein